MAAKKKTVSVLVVGGGGREHALCLAIARSKRCGPLYAAPGNAGIAQVATCIDIGAEDIDALVTFATDRAIDLVVVGPEAPLVAGLADRLTDAGVAVFGPSAAAAALEGSKAFMKQFCADHDIPTARWRRFDEPDAAKEHIDIKGAPIVVKADGLAAGKGVFVCKNKNEAFAAVDHIMTERTFGDAGDEVVIEQCMTGPEISVFALVDGETVVWIGSAQDHKAAHDGDHGPNTGGMGAYAPTPLVTADLQADILETVLMPTAQGLVRDGRPYRGVLFAGLMLTDDGPKLLEYNVRFGDPECQVLMARLESDVLDALQACAEGRLGDVDVQFSDDHAMVVVVAAKGYPGTYEKGEVIGGLDAAGGVDGVTVIHAGTKSDGDTVVSAGGRVLGVTAIGPDLRTARDRAYAGVDALDWPGGFWRTDIGWRALD